jgi:uncharacterized protein
MCALPIQKVHREDLKPNECLCDYCSAKCCKYFALPIDTPTVKKDFDYIRWYLLHSGASVFTEEGDWYLIVHSTCKHLQSDNRCGIYVTRPQICRDYSTVNCEYEEDWVYDHYFETPEQVEEYVEAVLSPKQRDPWNQRFRSPKPELLPIL